MSAGRSDIEAAELVLGCADLNETLQLFIDRLRFRLDAIEPAEDPAVATISGHGMRIVLRREDSAEDEHAAPVLQPSFVLSRAGEDAAWKTGRAGMLYRDLIPGRQGGRFIASHIRIEEGGPVPDEVHFHDIHFQMIYCVRGWVRLVYEDQGPPFVLQAGDCVLQPPKIRHRVLESSPGLEVIEVTCPAQHPTFFDHDMSLPTAAVDWEREYGGQRFVRHEAASAAWLPWGQEGFEHRDTGIAQATRGLAGANVLRRSASPMSGAMWSHDAELFFTFVLEGTAGLECEGRAVERLAPGDSYVVPAGMHHALVDGSDDLELLTVFLPDAFQTEGQKENRPG